MSVTDAPRVAAEDLASIDIPAYHRRSKHRLDGYAQGPETLDWDQQPSPFRRFEGAGQIQLPLSPPADTAHSFAQLQDYSLAELWQGCWPEPLSPGLASLAVWLRHALALSAWKVYGGARWSLRCNPSSGNLHPTEAYVVVAGFEDCANGVYHYRADCHGLELRCAFPAEASLQPGLYLGLSSIHWREAWKYGERAYRYSQLDIGHALAALACAAAPLGWKLEYLPLADSALESLLGLDRPRDFFPGEEEWGECLLRVATGAPASDAGQALDSLLAAAAAGQWQGCAEVLDRKHFYHWPLVDRVAEQVRRPASAEYANSAGDEHLPPALAVDYREKLYRLVLERRSAQGYDGVTGIGQAQFFSLLDHLLPRASVAPWMPLPGPASLHCVFFVHRVEGLEPGLYTLPRSEAGEVLLRRELRATFDWERVASAPAHLPFYRLVSARAERTAAKLCCQQQIAGASAFSLGMLAEFSSQLEGAPWRYRELFWEAGAIGQALYLEAEGIGLQGTGIGCFFDDAVHDLLGIGNDSLQSLYHFTVGGALRDPRIATLPAYGKRRQ
ncbi:nitroreductase family protein [Haliea sp. E17]|uniref:nitroreductase family protein n=1 Tax=Haliea sp. E17 TaxID=3401576 RepID=UPI003AB069EE